MTSQKRTTRLRDLTDEEEEPVEWYLKTRSTRPPSTFLVDKIAHDEASRLEKKEDEKAKSPSHDAMLYRC